jgi:recombination protein RecR
MDAADVTIAALMARLAKGEVKELIMGTNPNFEGDGTALHIQNEMAAKFPQIQVTRLARGLPAGSSIEHANRNILSDALTGRQRVS